MPFYYWRARSQSLHLTKKTAFRFAKKQNKKKVKGQKLCAF
jgi:hypothetical protein